MTLENVELYELLYHDSNIIAAWFDNPEKPTRLYIKVKNGTPTELNHLPASLKGLMLHVQPMPKIRTLITPVTKAMPLNVHQLCQDEPVELGCQIQPSGADWLGTAGSPCQWLNADGDPVFGILSNWHVMASGLEKRGRTQHQPTTNKSAIAKLSYWSPVTDDEPNKVDAAIADALIDGYHTISPNIMGIGPIGDHPINAHIGLDVRKSGRTTGVTQAKCVAVGAAIQVGYGEFTATFIDQDVYSALGEAFSAPGDSGSLIVGASCRCPCSLLFAGNSLLTIGNPIRHVNEAFGLIYPFPT